MARALTILALVAVVGLGVSWVLAGRAAGPVIEIVRPAALVGRAATFEATIQAPGSNLSTLDAFIEQGGQRYPLFSLDQLDASEIRQDAPDRIRVSRAFDRATHPELSAGEALVRVTASRPVLFGLRDAVTDAEVSVTVRLDPPRLTVVSTFHHVNHGGAELVLYRVDPPDAESGVMVGERFYPGYPASGLGVTGDEALRAAFFALSYDQDLETPIGLLARDQAGNEGRATFEYRVFPRNFRRSRLPITDSFLRRVVPPIVAQSPELADEELGADPAVDDLLELYLYINGRMRERNRETVAALAGQTSPGRQWDGPFRQLTNSQVESGFADHRTYVYDDRDIDQQIHLGFDLASTANAPVRAASQGTVVFADYLGIYGNCVIVDHGMGLQSLYAHLSSIDVAAGDSVTSDEPLGLSGRTGLAGGDHLHFTMLLQGRPVSSVEWWDAHWIEDRVTRKLREAGSRGE